MTKDFDFGDVRRERHLLKPILFTLTVVLAAVLSWTAISSLMAPPPEIPPSFEFAPYDEPITGLGDVTYVHFQTWQFDPRTSSGDEITVIDEQLWWQPDGTAVAKTCPRQEPARRIYITLRDAETGPCTKTTRHGPGQFSPGLPGPPSSDQTIMAQQLSSLAAGNGDAGLLRAVAAMYRVYHLQPRQRTAILLTLAGHAPSLKFHGEITDRAGRKGQAFAAVSGDETTGVTRDILIFDSTTGALLNYEQHKLTSSPGSNEIPPLTVTAFCLYLDSRILATIPATAT